MYADKHLLYFHYSSFTGTKNIALDKQNSGAMKYVVNFNVGNCPKREIKVLARKTCYMVLHKQDFCLAVGSNHAIVTIFSPFYLIKMVRTLICLEIHEHVITFIHGHDKIFLIIDSVQKLHFTRMKMKLYHGMQLQL